MATKNNANCAICGKPYHVCMSCLDSIRLSPWKIHTDTSEHFKIYQIIHGFTSNVYNKNEARIKLNNIDLQDLESFRPNIKEIIKDILKEDIVVENVIDTEKVENITKPTISRKRNYKVNNEVEETK